MRKDPNRSPAEAGAIHETSMTELVHDNHVVLPRQRGNRSQRRRITARKAQCGFGLLESSKSFLEALMMPVRAANQPGGSRAGTGLLQRVVGSLSNLRMCGQSEIVVGREVRQQASVARHLGPLGGFEDAQGAAQARALNALKLAVKKLVEIHPFIK